MKELYHNPKYICSTRSKRVILSNAIPNHDVIIQNPNAPCEYNWVVELPLHPKVSVASKKAEIPIRGPIAMAVNGVPAYNAQEGDSLNSVEPPAGDTSVVQDAQFWYGHANRQNAWHFHNPHMGYKEDAINENTLLGYAFDGFPIYGPLIDDGDDPDTILDVCNGRFVPNSSQGNDDDTGMAKYQYHVRTKEQVDETKEYCNGENPYTNWNYILGCYSGSLEDTAIYDSTTYSLDDDCILEYDSSNGATTTSASGPTYEKPIPPPPPAAKDQPLGSQGTTTGVDEDTVGDSAIAHAADTSSSPCSCSLLVLNYSTTLSFQLVTISSLFLFMVWF